MPRTWAVAREIVGNDGFGTRGLLKGLTATLIRNSIFNGVYLGSYFNMKQLIPSSEVYSYISDCVTIFCSHTY